jgi:hypothetical protein
LWAPDGHVLLFHTGRSLGEAGLVAAAMQHFVQRSNEATNMLGPDHPDTLIFYNWDGFWHDMWESTAFGVNYNLALSGSPWVNDIIDAVHVC